LHHEGLEDFLETKNFMLFMCFTVSFVFFSPEKVKKYAEKHGQQGKVLKKYYFLKVCLVYFRVICWYVCCPLHPSDSTGLPPPVFLGRSF